MENRRSEPHFLARIVRRIDVGDGERPLTVDPALCSHPCSRHSGSSWRRLGKSAGPQRYAFLHVELVAHAEVQRA